MERQQIAAAVAAAIVVYPKQVIVLEVIEAVIWIGVGFLVGRLV